MSAAKVKALRDEQRTLRTWKRSLSPRGKTIVCEHCDGRGARELRVEERETVDALSYEWLLTSDIAECLPKVARTALINRLTHLERVGLVESKTAGPRGAKMWRLAP